MPESTNTIDMFVSVIPNTTVQYRFFLLSKFTLQVRQQKDKNNGMEILHQPISYLPEPYKTSDIEEKE